MNNNLAWVKGIIPGQPEWVCETIAAEFDLYDERLAGLGDENRALRAKLPRWIPVTERLPHETESRYVIVACSTGAVRETIYCPNSDFFKRRFERTWNSDPISGLFECGAEFGYTITHWMPLPAAPEQEPSV